MRFHDSDDFNRADGLQLLHTGPKLARRKAHQIFQGMVRAECRNGALSPLRRRRLIQYAAALQLTPVEAGKIVSEISRETAEAFNQDVPALYRMVETAARPARWPTWLKVGLTLSAAFAVDRLIRQLW